MRAMRAWLRRLRGVFAGAGADRDLAAELESHLQLHIDDNLRAGMSPDEARRQAILALGGVEPTKERYRDRRGLPALDALWQDVRYAVRVLAKRPLLLAATTLSIAIGTGINVSVYSVLQRVLFDPLIAGDAPARLVWVTPGISYLNFEDLRTARLPIALATMTMTTATWRTAQGTTTISAHVVSDNFFDVVRVRPAIGRTFHEGDANAAVLSHGFWRQRFGADPAIIDRPIEINGAEYTIAGVLPEGFRSQAVVSPAVYVPTGRRVAGALDNRRAAYFDLVGRLADGATREQATAALRVAAAQLEGTYPSENPGFARRLTVVSGHALSVFDAVLPAGVAIGAAGLVYAMAGLVLIIACANVAGLLVARADERAREIAVRIALGATRARLAQQLVAESAVIAALGCACGGACWIWCAALVRTAPAVVAAGVNVLPASLPLLYCAGLAVLVTVACGVAPAWTAGAVTPATVIQAGRSGRACGRLSLQRALVAGQVAISFLLLTAAALLVLVFVRSRSAESGIDVAHTVAVQVRLARSRGGDFFWLRDAVERVAGVDGVSCDQSVTPPVTFTTHLQRSGVPDDPGYATAMARVGPHYFAVLGVPIERGREFTDSDFRSESGTVPIVVNQAFARRYLGGADPLGRQFLLPGDDESGRDAQIAAIVGVVRDTSVSALNHDRVPAVYTPALTTFLVVRVKGPAVAAIGDLERAITTRDAGAAVSARTMGDRLAAARVPTRAGAMLMLTLGALAIVVAMTGLYGVVSDTANRRTFEIGVRLALGATRPAILRLILGDGLRLVALGCVAGAVLAVLFTQAAAAVLSTAGRTADPLAFAGVLGIVVTAGLAATLWPARRASSVDPVIALRHE